MIVEPVVGTKDGVAVGLKCGAVPIVGAALSDQGDLRAGRTSGARARVKGGDAKLLDCLGIQSKHRSLLCLWRAVTQGLAGLRRSNGIADRLINVHTIQGYV